MYGSRKHPRFKFEARCVLLYEGSAYEGRILNVSLGGAMFGLDESVMIPQDEICRLQLFTGENETPDEIDVSVVYSTFFCLGVKFLVFDGTSHPQLYAQLELLSQRYEKDHPSEPDRLLAA